MAIATRPRRLTALEKTLLTPEQELERLVAEQAADDTHWADIPSRQVSLDSPAPSGEGGTLGSEMVGRDPWDLIDAAIDLGLDPAELAFSGDLIDAVPSSGGLLGGGLIDARSIPHGTAGAYQNHKCRCIPCTVAWASYKRDRRAAKKAAA